MFEFQKTEYFCGPASIRNAFALHGKTVSQRGIADVCGTTINGTDEDGLKRGCLAYGSGYDEMNEATWLRAKTWLLDTLARGFPVLLCVDHWQHWVCAFALSGDRIVLFDPAREPLNMRGNGIHVLKLERFRARWEAGRKARGKLGAFYGLAVGMPAYK